MRIRSQWSTRVGLSRSTNRITKTKMTSRTTSTTRMREKGPSNGAARSAKLSLPAPVVIGNRRSVFKIWQAPNLQPSAGGIQQDRRLRTGSTLGFPAEDLFRLGHLTSEVARYREAQRVAA